MDRIGIMREMGRGGLEWPRNAKGWAYPHMWPFLRRLAKEQLTLYGVY